MLKYAVILCPKCGKARGIETRRKTMTCPCGRKIVLSRAKHYFETDNPLELADAVADANEKLADGLVPKVKKRRRRRDSFSRIAERARAAKDPSEKLRIIASDLTELKGEFTVEDLRKVSSVVGKEPSQKVLNRMQSMGLVYESSPGRFKVV
ncbi:hypothetical protein E2P63_09040 [Candidatus Bathyarchaeota archaeon]|nr:hypothetical protein E2P63_09040 [Candidatus Bathyarchaeota archaeon]